MQVMHGHNLHNPIIGRIIALSVLTGDFFKSCALRIRTHLCGHIIARISSFFNTVNKVLNYLTVEEYIFLFFYLLDRNLYDCIIHLIQEAEK